MSITQQLPVYTGTFTTKRGVQRTMNFVRVEDLPSAITSLYTRSRTLKPGFSTVYDVDKGAYRTFNYNTMKGGVTMSQRTVTIQG
jgi:hypothetical protein